MADDGGPIKTVEEADRVIDETIRHLEAAEQIAERESNDHTTRDEEPARQAFEEHLTQADRLCVRLMTKTTYLSARTRPDFHDHRAAITKVRAETTNWKGTATPNQLTKGS